MMAPGEITGTLNAPIMVGTRWTTPVCKPPE